MFADDVWCIGHHSGIQSKSAWLIGIAFFLSLASLGIKFKFRPVRRTLAQLAKDGTKQLVGAGYIHLMNAYFSDELLHSIKNEHVGACAWYFVQVMLDTTLGVWVAYMIFDNIMNTFRRLEMDGLRKELVQSERKEEEPLQTPLTQLPKNTPPPSTMTTLKQIVFWLVVITLMKISMVAIIFCLATPLQAIALLTFKFIPDSSKVVFVRIVVPCVMNTFQYWSFDNIFIYEYNRLMKIEALRGFDEKYNAEVQNTAELKGIIDRLQEEKASLVSQNASLQKRNIDLEEDKKELEKQLLQQMQLLEQKMQVDKEALEQKYKSQLAESEKLLEAVKQSTRENQKAIEKQREETVRQDGGWREVINCNQQ